MQERWVRLPGHDGAYEVSDQGRVRSWIGWHGLTVRDEPQILAQATNSAGYRTVVLRDRRSAQLVHHLVALSFHGPRPDGLFVCHIDGTKANNWANNLVYDTPTRNQLDRVRHGQHEQAAKTHCPQGHPYDDANTLRSKEGRHRSCRACRRKT